MRARSARFEQRTRACTTEASYSPVFALAFVCSAAEETRKFEIRSRKAPVPRARYISGRSIDRRRPTGTAMPYHSTYALFAYPLSEYYRGGSSPTRIRENAYRRGVSMTFQYNGRFANPRTPSPPYCAGSKPDWPEDANRSGLSGKKIRYIAGRFRKTGFQTRTR